MFSQFLEECSEKDELFLIQVFGAIPAIYLPEQSPTWAWLTIGMWDEVGHS